MLNFGTINAIHIQNIHTMMTFEEINQISERLRKEFEFLKSNNNDENEEHDECYEKDSIDLDCERYHAKKDDGF